MDLPKVDMSQSIAVVHGCRSIESLLAIQPCSHSTVTMHFLHQHQAIAMTSLLAFLAVSSHGVHIAEFIEVGGRSSSH